MMYLSLNKTEQSLSLNHFSTMHMDKMIMNFYIYINHYIKLIDICDKN